MKHLNSILLLYCTFLLVALNTQAQNNSLDKPTENARVVKLERQPEYGKCYAKCINQEELITVEEQVLLQPDSNKYPNLTPVYETKEEQILVKKASFKLIAIPPVFETVIDSINIIVFSSSGTQTEHIQVSPETGYWTFRDDDSINKKSCITAKNPEECQVVCWEKIPAEYTVIDKKVVQTMPADYKETDPEYQTTVEKKLLKTPAILKMIESPAEYLTVNRQIIVAYKNGEEPIEPQYTTIRKVKTVEEIEKKSDWQEVVCDVQINQDLIKLVQQGLKDKGYYDGPIDGVQNVATNQGLQKFKRDINFPLCQFCSGRLLKALGVDWP